MSLRRHLQVAGFALSAVMFCQTLQAAPEYIINKPTPVSVGGQSGNLQPGQAVQVVSAANGFATIRFTLANGTTGAAMVPIANLQPKAAAPAQPVPAETSPSAPVATTPTPTPTQTLLKPGWNNVQLEALPNPARKPNWFHYDFDPKVEKFTIFVPNTLGSNKPCGILGWTNPGDGSGIPKKFEALFEEYRLIVVAAEKCGNNQPSDRRAGLLVSATLQLSKMLPVNKDRIILSGLSGGGRLSALGVFCHPEIFSGAISWCGGHFYKDYPDSSKPNFVNYGFPTAEKINDPKLPACVAEAQKRAKFVLLTGPKDFNLGNSHDIETAMKKEHFQVQLIEEPDLGHAVGSPETMRQALEFVLGKPPLP